MVKEFLKEWNTVTLRDHLVNRKTNPEYVADGFQPILPVTAVSFEALRICRGSCELSEVANPDDTVEHHRRLAFTEKPPPHWDRLGSTHDPQQLRPPAEISIKD